jgi:hypothetical protein
MSSSDRVTSYCTVCRVEVPHGAVCPRCHRKATLVPQGTAAANPANAGDRRAARSSASLPVAGQRRPRWPGLVLLGGLVVAGIAIAVASWPRTPRDAPTGPAGPAAPAEAPRVFGADPPRARPPVPPAPRRCGARLRLSVTSRFQAEAPSAMAAPPAADAGAAKVAGPRPTALTRTSDVILSPEPGGGLAVIPLSLTQEVVVEGRTVPVVKLDRTGADLPDPRTRKRVRRGPDDLLAPGLRLAELVGRVQAVLGDDADGGLRVLRYAHESPLVKAWVGEDATILDFLRPRPPRPDAATFEDRRPLPAQGTGAATPLVRRFRRASTPGEPERFEIDSPRGAIPEAKGAITLDRNRLPAEGSLILTPVQQPDGRTGSVTYRIESPGEGCTE